MTAQRRQRTSDLQYPVNVSLYVSRIDDTSKLEMADSRSLRPVARDIWQRYGLAGKTQLETKPRVAATTEADPTALSELNPLRSKEAETDATEAVGDPMLKLYPTQLHEYRSLTQTTRLQWVVSVAF
jgi:hypothetical protein